MTILFLLRSHGKHGEKAQAYPEVVEGVRWLSL